MKTTKTRLHNEQPVETTSGERSAIAALSALSEEKQARMLGLTLERIKAKMAQGMALSIKEHELLTECRRRYHSKPRVKYQFDQDGSMTIEHSVDIGPVQEMLKNYTEVYGRGRNDKMAGAQMVGALDEVTAVVWSHETGLKIGTKEFAEFAKKRIQNDIDYRVFRVGG